jgi:hypothetical protein
MSELPALTLLTLAAAQPRGEATLLQAEIGAALLDLLLATPIATARVASPRGADGALVLETPKGPIAVPNGPDLPRGAEVEVRLASRTPTLVSVRLLTSPPAGVAAATAAPGAVVVPPPAAEIVRGAPLPAVLLAAPPEDMRPPGTPLLVRIIALALPASVESGDREAKGGNVAHVRIEAVPLPGVPAGAALAPAKAAPASAGRAPAEPGEPDLVPGAPPERAEGRSIAPSPLLRELETPADATLSAPRRLRAAATALGESELVGPVVTRTAAGAVIQTPRHTIAVEGLDVPEGSLIRFLLLEPPAALAPARPVRRAPWSALAEALRTLEKDAPETAERFVADLHPRDPPRLAATIRLVAAALRDQSMPFPGKAIEETLRAAGHADLVPALRDEMRTLGRIAAEPTQQWQVLPLPLHDGAQLTPAFLYVERDARRDPQTGDEARRFVLDVQTRVLGRLQLDGLLRPKRFDLLLRSRVPLDKIMRGEIEHLFRATLDSAGWSGDVAFSTVPAFTDEPAGKYRERVAALA